MNHASQAQNLCPFVFGFGNFVRVHQSHCPKLNKNKINYPYINCSTWVNSWIFMKLRERRNWRHRAMSQGTYGLHTWTKPSQEFYLCCLFIYLKGCSCGTFSSLHRTTSRVLMFHSLRVLSHLEKILSTMPKHLRKWRFIQTRQALLLISSQYILTRSARLDA